MGIHNFSNSFNTTKLQISCKYLSKQGDSYRVYQEMLASVCNKYKRNLCKFNKNATLIHRKTRLLNYTASSCSEFY